LLNKRGSGLLEALLVTLLIGVLMSGIFVMLNVAQSSRASAAKMEVRAEVRRCMDWLVNDLRQSLSWSVGSSANNPTSSHIKFKKVTGYSTAGSGSAVLGNFIEYTYDSASSEITRADLGTGETWVFRYITQAPFYTRLSDGSIAVIDPVSAGNDSPVFTTRNMVLAIFGQKQVTSGVSVDCMLTEEVRIRN
jgi:hypothetical protein